MRSARHFFASRALPPYPLPYDQISRVSGKCAISLTSLDGHGTSGRPTPSASSSGMPTECSAGTHSVSVPIAASASSPVLVMIAMEATA